MKKTLLLALAAVATIFTSCSSDITNDNDDSNNGQGKGMTLIANVEQDDTRATLTTSDDTSGKWSFAYTDNDEVEVGNDQMDNKYYTFTNNGANFSCADAKATNTDATWYAYYPGTDIDLTNQDGKADGSAAKLYALAGATTTATTGAEGLTIKMKAQAAVLRIVKVDNYGPCDIYLKTDDGKYVKGLKAKTNEAGYEVETSDTKVSVFYKAKEGNAGIYYVIVPAGVKISVWNNDRCFKTTKDAGLTAGKYYTLTSGPTSGTATANGETKPIGWVQMWIGGPRIAVKNASDKMTWAEARKTGDDYIWGKNWRTASSKEVEIMGKKAEYGTMLNNDILTGTYEYNNTIHGFTLKGKQPGYISNNLYLSGNDKSNAERVEGDFWVTDELNNGYATTMTFIGNYDMIFAFPMQKAEPNSLQEVRPVLTIKTVLWGEQNIQ